MCNMKVNKEKLGLAIFRLRIAMFWLELAGLKFKC